MFNLIKNIKIAKHCAVSYVLFISIVFVSALPFSSHAETNTFSIHYNEKDDTLDINAQNIYLITVLDRLSLLTGIAIDTDASLDTVVNVTLTTTTVEEAINHLTRKLNIVKRYEPLVDGENVLVEVKLLKKGEKAIPVTLALPAAQVDFTRYGELSSYYEEKLTQLSLSRENRWTKTINALPPHLRTSYQDFLAKKTERELSSDLRYIERDYKQKKKHNKVKSKNTR